jgi:RHS repeat-associated protein
MRSNLHACGFVYSPVTDALGSILALTNSSGNTITQFGYDPYGDTTSNGSTSTNVFEYTGRENDSNGLYYFRARYYSPQFGRFISEDPASWLGGINLYGYARENPLRFRDPSGLCTRPTCTEAFVHHLLDYSENDTVKEIAGMASTATSAVTTAATTYSYIMQQSAMNYIYSVSQQGMNPFANGMAGNYLANAEGAQEVAEGADALGGLADGIAGEGVPGAVSSGAAASVVLPAAWGLVVADEVFALKHEMSDFTSGRCVTEFELIQAMTQ